MDKQKIQQCIKDCQSAMSEIQSLSSQATDTKLKSTLEESAHHLDMCMRECEFAAKQAP
jgi:BMFP domain-containing protein YqiC